MIVNDINLMLRFERKPRVLGTFCSYAPKNKLLHTPGLVYGEEVRIVALPESAEDVFISVTKIENMPRSQTLDTETVTKEWIAEQGLTADQIKLVIWKDLVH